MPRSALSSLAISLAALVAAVALRWLLDDVLGDALPLVTLFGAVAVAVWAGGWRHAALVAALGYVAIAYFFIEPRGALGLDALPNVIGLVAYAFTCALIIAIGEAMLRARADAGEQGELLRVTLASIGDAVITTDVDGRVTYLNAVAESLTGWSRHDARGRPLDEVFRIVGERDRLPVGSPAIRALREGAIVGFANHTILIAKDGTEHPIDDSAAPIKDERGTVSGCVLIFRDVATRRRLEQDEAERFVAARQLASIVESSDDAIIRKSLDGTIQSWNAAAERVFGYTAAQAVGRHISLVIPPDRRSEEDQIIAMLKAGRRVDHFETVRVRADGRPIVVSLTISPIMDADGKVIAASKIVREVTRQREAEERERRLFADAAAANAKFRAFFEQGALFAGIMDVDGTLIDANRLSWEGCGFTREQCIGIKFWDGPWWNPSAELVARIRDASARAAKGEPYREEIPYYVGDGSRRIADVSIQPIRDDAGRIMLLAPTGSDITERKRLEVDLRKLASDLADADRRKDEFLATLAHELRNPLAPLTNMLEVVRRSGHDESALRSAVDMMARQTSQLVRLVDDLLDLSRITHNRLDLRRNRVDLATVIRQALQASQPLCDAADHTLRVTLPPDPVPVDADPVRLAQVFGNLINNSCKYTPPGGTVEVTMARTATEAVVTVRDTGIGIPRDKLESIFEMFTQVDPTLERSQGGLGIGLTLVRRLVQMHGGSVVARSEGEHRGSEFTVRLPLASALAPTAAAHAPHVPAAHAQPQRVLIVDDNRDAASSLAMLLELEGHKTVVAHDGPSALEAAERHRPDVMLLDIGLPGMNGYDVGRAIRRHPWGAALTLIALTGWGQAEDRRRSQEAGFDRHLVKPVDPVLLLELLARPRAKMSAD